MLLGCGDGSQQAPLVADLTALVDEEQALLSAYFPGAVYQTRMDIPVDQLSSHDIEHGNVFVVGFYDERAKTLGFMRTIFTPVACVAGACAAIRFSLLYAPDLIAFEVFNPPDTEHVFRKYAGEDYLEFSEADHDKLRSLIVDPPAILVELPSEEDLVEDIYATAATQLEYQDAVVQGAAFTSYVVMSRSIDTGTVLVELRDLGLLVGGAP